MRIPSRSFFPFLLVLSAAAVPLACKGGGCGGDNASPASSGSAANSSSASPVASASAKPRAIIRAGGSTGTILRAVQGLQLSDEQKSTMEQIANDLHASNAAEEDGGSGARTEMKELHTELIEGVKAGKLDTAKIDEHEKALETAARDKRLKDADALNRAWKMLEPEQRKTVAGQVRTIEEKRQARMHRRDKDGGAPPNFAKMKFEHYTKDLALDADQQKKAQALMPKDDKNAPDPADEAKKQLDDVLAGFESDSFDARKFESAESLKKHLNPMADTVKFLGGLAPVLKQEQRDKLAAQLEKERGGPGNDNRMRHRGPGPGGPNEEEEFLNF